MFVKIFR